MTTNTDGITWTDRTSRAYKHLRRVTWGGNQFVAVDNSSTILTSPDGIIWTARNSGTTNYLEGVTWGGNQFVAVGNYSTILTSPDGITWTARPSGATNRLNGVTWGGNQFVAVGWFETILTSPDGITWTDRTFGVTDYLGGVTWGENQFIVVGNSTTILNGIPCAQTTITYDGLYRTTEVLDPENRKTKTEYKNNYSDVKLTTDRNNNKTQYDTDANGNILKIINPDLSVKEMTYDTKNNQRSIKDEKGIYTFYVYDANSINLLKKVQPLNGTDQYVDGTSNPVLFAITEYTYYTDAECQSLGYKAKGLVKTVKDPKGNITTYTYDAFGNVKTVKDPLGNITTAEANALGWTTKAISPAPKSYQTQYFYDSNGAIEKVVLNGGETTRMTYDTEGRKSKEVSAKQYDPAKDNLSNHSYSGDQGYRYTYYDNGLMKTATDPENNTTKYTFDVYGNISTATLPNGSIYQYEYDIMNRLKKVYFKKDINSEATILEEDIYAILYNDVFTKTQKTVKIYFSNINISSTTYTYDYAGRVVEQKNPDNTTIKTEYYPNGLVKSVTDPKGNITSYTYDGLNRLVEEKIPFENNSGTIYYTIRKSTYDKNGNLISQKTTKNKPGEAEAYNETGYEYDARNLLVKVTTYDNGTPVNYTQYYYDAEGNKVRMYTGLSKPLLINGLDNVTPQGDTVYSTTKYEYNHMGKMVKLTDPLSKTITYGYDPNGNLNYMLDKNNNTTNATFDNMNRQLTKNVTCSDSTCNASYSYTYDSLGSIKTMNGGGVNATYEYDGMGRCIKESQSNGVVKEYTYDNTGRRATFKLYVSGQLKQDLSYSYDVNGRLYQIKENGSVIAEYLYDVNGNRTSFSYIINGITTKYTYNLANKLRTLANKKGTTILSQYSYNYYLDGNQESKTESAGSTSYVYDGLSRLKTVTEPGSVATSYTYDDSNNRKTMTVTGGSNPFTVSYDYDNNNRLLKETKTVGTNNIITNYVYDGNGNQITKGTGTYKYNGFNQLIQANEGGLLSKYTYNGAGLRISKVVGSVVTTNVWDGDQIALELNGSGIVTNKYVRGINLLYAEDGAGANRKYYMYNGHGDVTQLTDAAGNVVKSYEYDAFGNEKNPNANDTNVFRYCGEYFDKETGTIYLRARYYDARIGRFISEDSNWGKVNNSLSLNLYTYCWNNPISFVDVTGNWPSFVEDPIGQLKNAWNALKSFWAWRNEIESNAEIELCKMAEDQVRELFPGVDENSEFFKEQVKLNYAISTFMPIGGMSKLTNLEKSALILENAAKGRTFEKAGISLLGYVKNTEKIGGRIADILIKNSNSQVSAIIEFKNVQSLSKSEQLTTFINQAGKNFSLVVNENTKIAGTLWNQIREAGGHIYRMVDDKLVKIL